MFSAGTGISNNNGGFGFFGGNNNPGPFSAPTANQSAFSFGGGMESQQQQQQPMMGGGGGERGNAHGPVFGTGGALGGSFFNLQQQQQQQNSRRTLESNNLNIESPQDLYIRQLEEAFLELKHKELYMQHELKALKPKIDDAQEQLTNELDRRQTTSFRLQDTSKLDYVNNDTASQTKPSFAKIFSTMISRGQIQVLDPSFTHDNLSEWITEQVNSCVTYNKKSSSWTLSNSSYENAKKHNKKMQRRVAADFANQNNNNNNNNNNASSSHQHQHRFNNGNMHFNMGGGGGNMMNNESPMQQQSQQPHQSPSLSATNSPFGPTSNTFFSGTATNINGINAGA
jgi:hypothetical protein